MRVHKVTIAALAVAAGLSLTACQNGDDGKGESAPSSASSPAGGSTGSAGGSSDGGSGAGSSDQGGGKDSAGKTSGGQGSTAGTGSDTNSKTGKCRTADLQITASDSTIDGDDDLSVAVTLKNTSGRNCTISGYAGVDLKTNAGSLSAQRTGQEPTSGVLKNGESVAFGITYPANDSGGSGVRITGLLVTPPDETRTVTLNWPGAATLPVTEGGGSPVKVGPIGSAGQGG
ncbi:DUF4232 domain-containing protein [Streptomyces longispororuber]|uniref:DUF4232 domain-containing protein n=1 Tax=Streptomyces longispororuber TaxID=68230 RepID=UPI002109BD1A|nr:DUF4232 domain-containing protein [Streptomyces longispororuber]MCQ4207395.1 DUF4232 domain-containing protein [Streptomyces longispororuber]